LKRNEYYAKASFGFGDVNGCYFKKNILLKLKMNKEETLEQLKEIIKPYTNNQEAFDNFSRHRLYCRFKYKFSQFSI
jgi:hypothetical protein